MVSLGRANLNKAGREVPEIREDLYGRVELFDQSVRSFERRLRAVERRLSLETPPDQGAFSGFSGPSSGQPGPAVSNSVSPAGPSVCPVGTVLPDMEVPHADFGSFPAEDMIDCPFASLASSATPLFSPAPGVQAGNSTGTEKIRELNALFAGFSESLQALETSLSELSGFVHNGLVPEIERLDAELEERKVVGTDTAEKLGKRLEIVENQTRLTFGSIKVPVEISGITGAMVLFLTGSLVWLGRWDLIRSPFFSVGLAFLMAAAVFFKFYMMNRERETSEPGGSR